jgi:hypothetical protein
VTRARAVDLAAACLVVILAVVNATLLPRSLSVILEGGPAVDWEQFVEAGRRVFASDLYEVTDTYGYRWSPVAAYGFAAMAPMGALAWRLLHVVAALALPTWPMRLITLAAWPFWYDVEAGNVMVFVLLAGAWAIRGNAVGIAAFVTLSLLVPRPLMLPILGWILWQRPEWRIPAVVMAAVHLAVALASGWGIAWVDMLLTLGGEQGSPNNLGPTRWLGAWWLLIGVPLAIVLTRKGRLGWASLAVSYPYVLPYYLLMLVLEVPDRLMTALRLGSAKTSL